MPQSWLRWGLLAVLCLSFAAVSFTWAEDKPGHSPEEHGKKELAKGAKYIVHMHHEKKEFNPADPAEMETLAEHLKRGEIDDMELQEPPENPMKIAYDLGLWSIVIFVFLLLVLRKMAWTPMLQGLQKREETIRNSVEEAKKARAETERISNEFKGKMDLAYAEIPKIMEQARKDADAFKEDMRTQTAKDIQTERQRLRREIETARDQALQELWNQAAQMATLISAKAIGRSLTEDDHRRLMDEAMVELRQSSPGRG